MELLPPNYVEKDIYCALKRKGGKKAKFSRKEIMEAINAVKARYWDQPEFIPSRFSSAICSFVKLDREQMDGKVSLDELRMKFPSFVVEGNPVDTVSALDAIELQLTALNQASILHSSILPYADRTKHHKQRLTLYHRKTLQDPWSNPKYKLKDSYGTNPFSSITKKRVTVEVTRRLMSGN